MENQKSCVLIVDDMRINRIVLASILATHGINSDQADATTYASALSGAEIVSSDGFGDSVFDIKKEIEKLPVWLKIIPQLDLSAGVTNCGDREDYLDALYIFYSSVDEKADELESFNEYEDWTMYALRVHSLKSIARLIGAKKLGKTAAILEAAAREENYSLIKRETWDFLKSYREFKHSLSPIEKEEIFTNKTKEPQQTSPESSI